MPSGTKRPAPSHPAPLLLSPKSSVGAAGAAAHRDPIVVLLVEDDPADAELIALRLEAPSDPPTSAPIHLLQADSLAAAQAILDTGVPDVIILDLSLPDASGLEALHRIRTVASGIPIVVLSGLVDEAVALDALRAGAQDCVRKPPPDGSTLRRILRYARERQQLLMELDLASHASAAAAQRWRLLAEVGKTLAASSDGTLPLGEVCGSLVPQGSDAAVIYFTGEEEGSARLEVAHVEAGRAAEARERVAALADRPDAPVKRLLAVLRTAEGLPQSELNEYSEPIAAAAGMATSVAAPIRSGGDVRGFLLLGGLPGRRDAATVTVFAHSIADRIGLEVDRSRLLRQTRQAVAARDRTFNIVSHDLGDPLSTIQICATALLDPDPPAFAGMRDMAQIIQRSASLMQEIVGDLLDRASLDSGRLALEREPTAVAEVVDLMQAMFGRATEERAVQFIVRTVPDLPEIDVDPHRIEQVLSNLLRNAVKFTPAGGRVVLSALLADDRPDAGVRFAVSDTGPGIPSEDLSHIFDWFWGSQQRGRSGSGLGLAIAKGLIETHGSQLKVESIPGQGATFSFTIPRLPRGNL